MLTLKSILRNWIVRKVLIILWHVVGVSFTFYLAFLLRFDDKINDQILNFYLALPVLLGVSIPVFLIFNQFSGLWRYYSIDDLARSIIASTTAVLLFSIIVKSEIMFPVTMSRMVLGLELILLTGWTTGSRAFLRYAREQRRQNIINRKDFAKRVLVCGNLDEVDLFIRSCSNDFEGKFCGIVTNEKMFKQNSMHGVIIFQDPIEEVGHLVEEKDITDIHILSPFNRPAETNLIIDSCAKAGVSPEFHKIPALSELAAGEISISMIKNVNISDLLGRVEANLDRNRIRDSIKNKKVLVSGAGGSIGSELCRQILSYKPKALVLFECSELALYTIENELNNSFPDSRIIAFAGDVRIEEDIHKAIDMVGGIDLIYHAAAYKHVPLMEKNVTSAFRNNVLGTARLSDVAEKRGVKRFILISSDKAVRPSNIMGATKRIAERYIQEREFKGTEFVAVRFGNVLGSSGSVIPLFKKQIKEGKSVTVTSPDIRRFFMTIPEAVDLVLMSGAVAERGQIMVLEMGEPVKIYDLAIRLIELSGLKPHIDVKVEFCGLRPGEKEYEEILTEDENVVETPFDRIWVMQKDKDKTPVDGIDLCKINSMILANNDNELRKLAIQYVPENTFIKIPIS